MEEGLEVNTVGETACELLGGLAKTHKRQKPGSPSKLKKQIDEIHKLPRSKQRFVSELLDTVLTAKD